MLADYSIAPYANLLSMQTILTAKAIWLFDRGFDGGYLLKTLMGLELQWIVRMLGTRNVESAEGPKRMDVLAEGLDLPHSVWVRTWTKGSRDVEPLVRFPKFRVSRRPCSLRLV